MRSFFLILIICQTFFEDSHAASKPKNIKKEEERLVVLNRKIDEGKSRHFATDRDMHQFWDSYRQLKLHFDSVFEDWICQAPEQLQEIHNELEHLANEVELAWHLKQDQYKQLKEILHHENYTDTGLSTGNDKVEDACQGLAEYVDISNHTSHVEKVELDQHLQEVLDMQIEIDTHPCPCLWAEWLLWSTCSTTCQAGTRYRERVIETPATNNGTECLGTSEEDQACNEDVCCPVNCVWAEWEDWGSCPSGCPPQEKTRIRHKSVVASCNGTQCEGDDFEEKSCSREVELEEKVAELESDLNECHAEQTNPPAANRQMKQAASRNTISFTTIVNSCLPHCNHRPGHCPNYCGPNGYCCMKGKSHMECNGLVGGELFHICTTMLRGPEKVASRNSLAERTNLPAANRQPKKSHLRNALAYTSIVSCLPHCNHRPGHCPNYCGPNGYCCMKGRSHMECNGIEGGELFHTCVVRNVDINDIYKTKM